MTTTAFLHPLTAYDRDARRLLKLVRMAVAKKGLPANRVQGALTRDPESEFVAFFAVFDHQWILQHARQPFSAFFNRELLHDLSTSSGYPAFKSNSDGVRIAFVLDPGRLAQMPRHLPLPEVLEPDAVLLGLTAAGRPVRAPWRHHIMLAGMTDSGKSSCLRSIAYQALRAGHHLAVIDPLGKTFRILEHHPGMVALALDADTAPTVVEAVVKEVERRQRLFRMMPGYPEDLDEYNSMAADRGLEALPRYVFVIDEYNDLVLRHGGPKGELAQVTANIARVGRGFGITVVVAAQEWTREAAGSIRGQCETRLCFKVRDRFTAHAVAGSSEATRLTVPGRAVMAGSGLVQAYYLDKQRLASDAPAPEPQPTPAECDWILALHQHHDGAVNPETLAAVMGGRAGRNELLRIRDAWRANGWAAYDRARNNAIYLTLLALELAGKSETEPVEA